MGFVRFTDLCTAMTYEMLGHRVLAERST